MAHNQHEVPHRAPSGSGRNSPHPHPPMSGRRSPRDPPSQYYDPREDPDDPLSHLRHQFDRDRHNFFQEPNPEWQNHQHQRPWPEDRSGFFRTPRGFEDFNEDFPSHRFAGGFVDPHFFQDQYNPRHYRHHQQQQKPPSPQESRRRFSPERPNHHQEHPQGGTSIPIRVIHEKGPQNINNNNIGSKAKHPVTSRNTTELPAKGSMPQRYSEDSASPRLERAHSEPPKNFQQRMFQMPAPSNYSSIPEGSIPSQYHQHPRTGEDSLQVPRNLATSASAPSVPSSSPSPPNPPPRASKSRDVNQDENLRKQSAPPSVRHIPIHVEGRDVPVGASPGSFAKPSDYYPAGVKKVRHPEYQDPPQRQQQSKRDLPLKVNEPMPQQKQMPEEPTSPISPPPGPIPMGCSESHLNVPAAVNSSQEEPTSPIAPPKGPIPLPCSEEFLKDKSDPKISGDMRKSPENQNESEVSEVKLDITDSGAGKEPEEKNPAMDKLEKVQSEVADLTKRIQEFKGSKKDKEYLYLDEMLTRHLLALDGVDSGGRDDIRQMRKESIKAINRCLSMLDAKANDMSKDAEDNNKILSELAKSSKKK